MRFSLNKLLLALATLSIAGCSSGASHIPAGIEALPIAGQGNPGAPLDEYRIGVLDQLRISVFREPELSGDSTVDAAGNLNLPLIGEVPAFGRSASELADDIRQRLNVRYLRDAQVTVAITKPTSYTFTIEGELKKPGTYEIPGRVTLLQAVAIAEGVTERAKLSEVVVFRTINGQRHVARFDLRDIRLARSPDPMLAAGDTVVVNYSAAQQLYKDMLTVIPSLAGIFIALSQGN